MRVLLSCGEASGEAYAARLARELLALRPDLELVGIGGELMEREGVRLWAHREELAVMGFAEVLRHLPRILKLRAELVARARREPLSLFLPVDYPGFHVSLAGKLRRLGTPVLDFIPPKTWSWGSWRLRALRRSVDRCAVIFRFEEDYYRRQGVDARWVGHPLIEAIGEAPSRSRSGLLLAPGSREQELRRVVPVLCEIVRTVRSERPQLPIRVSLAPGVQRSWLQALVEEAGDVELREEALGQLLWEAEAALVTSGTATLEAALRETPHLILYRTSALSYGVARALVTVEHIGMANIVLGRRAFPEFLQNDLRAERILPALRELLDSPEAQEGQRRAGRELRENLGQPGALRRVAEMALGMLDR